MLSVAIPTLFVKIKVGEVLRDCAELTLNNKSVPKNKIIYLILNNPSGLFSI